MSTCGCTDTNPATPLPPNCNAIPAYVEPTPAGDTACCMACVFDDMADNWVKPVGEAAALLPVCDVTRFRADQCVAVVGTNGKGGVYKIEAVLTGELELSIYDGTTYDIGGAGTVQGGRVYLLPVCPLTQEALIEVIDSAIPSEFVLAVHSSSDTTHGFALEVVSGQIKLTFNQANFESTVADALANIGVTWFVPEPTSTVLGLVTATDFSTPVPYTASGSIDYAADFGTTIPPNASHALLLIENTLVADTPIADQTAGDQSHATSYLRFDADDSYKLLQHSESVMPTVLSGVSPSRKDIHVQNLTMYVPITAGETAWDFTATFTPTPAGSLDGGGARVQVRLLGWLISP